MAEMLWPGNVEPCEFFKNNAIADGSSRMNSEVYRAILPAQIKLNTAKCNKWCFTVQKKSTTSNPRVS